jgi:hypothetical protein
MQDKEKLKKLLDIFEEVLKIKGNEWLIDALLERIKKVSSIEAISKHPLIKDIYEHCLEKVIDNQAKEFYKDFKIEQIKAQLISDFKKMEHERRRNDFEGFCLSMYQQLEAIINWLFKEEIECHFKDIKDDVVIEYLDKGKKEKIRKTLTEEALGGSSKWNAFPKFKVIAYVYYYKMRKPLPYSYMTIKETFYEIYQERNINHREGEVLPFQKEILGRIKGNESKYYLKFYGFLEEFIRTINENFKNYETKVKENSNSDKIKNTIEANNPALKEMLEKMKKE